MQPNKTAEQLKAELIAWKEREAAERMKLLRRGESGGLAWDGCRVLDKSLEDAELLYELRLDAERG